MFTSVLRSPDAVDGGAAPAATAALGGDTHATSTGEGARATELPLRGVSGQAADLRLREPYLLDRGPLSDGTVRNMLADVCHFLRQIVAVTSAVVETIGLGQVRKIVGPELALPRWIIGEDGKCSDKATPPEPDPSTGSGQGATGRDHRKGPRGSKHPLTVLIQIAMQAAKLLEKIAAGTNPTAVNKEPLANRLNRMADREQRLADKGQPYMECGR